MREEESKGKRESEGERRQGRSSGEGATWRVTGDAGARSDPNQETSRGEGCQPSTLDLIGGNLFLFNSLAMNVTTSNVSY